jgi:hypothetical protein
LLDHIEAEHPIARVKSDTASFRTLLKVTLKGEFILSIQEKKRYLDFPVIRIP